MDSPRHRGSPNATLKAFLTKQRIAGLFFHCLLARHLTRAGFDVRHVEREDNHAHVWVLKLLRGRVPADRAAEWVQQQVCLLLKRHGLRYPRKEVWVMVQGDRLKVAFRWERGKPGWISFYRAKQSRSRSKGA